MAVKFRGDFQKLKHWEELAKDAPGLLPVVSENLADETISLVRDGMNRGVDPYGRGYAPLKFRAGQPLQKTGGMLAAWNRQHANRTSFKISNAKNYSGYHQHGTGIYGKNGAPITPKSKKSLRVPTGGGDLFFRSVKGTPKRMMVPDRRGIPGHWKRSYQAVVNEIFLSHFRSR